METFTDDIVVALASFLSPHDMLSLALSCKRFGDKHGTDKKQSAASREESTGEVRQRTESISLMEVAAHTVLHTKRTEDEKNALTRNEDESWIGLYEEFLKLFHYPLQFEKLVGESINYVGSNQKSVFVSGQGMSAYFHSAICSNILRAGKHSVSFNVDNPTGSNGITLGIMRPTTNDITSLTSCHPVHDDLSRFSLKDYENLHNDNVDCCLLDTCMGNGEQKLRWKKWEESELAALAALDEEEATRKHLRNFVQPFDWEGKEETQETSFKIGMVLDLDEGTLDVSKNDQRLETMRSGLVGEYCWVVSLKLFGAQFSVSIGR